MRKEEKLARWEAVGAQIPVRGNWQSRIKTNYGTLIPSSPSQKKRGDSTTTGAQPLAQQLIINELDKTKGKNIEKKKKTDKVRSNS